MRNYEKENEWKTKKYDHIQGYINKEFGTKLRLKLKEKNISIANWITECAKKYLEKDEI